MIGFLVSPDRKLGYSVMFSYAGGNRRTEWWVWDLQTHQVIKTQPFESRPTFRFGLSSDGKKLYLYGSGSTLEIFDASTLASLKLIYLNKDITTNLVTLARK
jgi:WD40 repeat protein